MVKARILLMVVPLITYATTGIICSGAPQGEFKRLICRVIDFDKGTTILFNQHLASKPFNSR